MKGIDRPFMTAFRLFVAVLLGFSVSVAVAERVQDLPKPTDYVSDYAHVLSAQEIARIDNICQQLDKSAANAQIAVVTVRTLDGVDSADFANQLEDKWKIGRKGTDRGVLVLLAINDHKRRIEVGYGLEGILPDAKLGDIGREMVPYLRANDFDSAVGLAVGSIGQVIADDAKVTLQDAPNVPRHTVHKSSGVPIFLIIWVVIILGSLILRLIFGRTRWLRWRRLVYRWWWRRIWRREQRRWWWRRRLGFGGFGGGSFGGGGAGGDW